MFLKKLKLMVPAVLLCGIISGCSVNNYYSSSDEVDVLSMSSNESYKIASSQMIHLELFDNNNRLTPIELKLLDQMMKLQAGGKIPSGFEKDLALYQKNLGYLKVVHSNTADMSLSAKMANPVLFGNSSESVPINIRSMIVLSPEMFSTPWLISYIATVGLIAPLKMYNFGALLVAVMDADHKIIGTKMFGLYRTAWFSTLFPFALCSGEKISGKSAFFQNIIPGESTMQNTLVMNAVVEILCGGKSSQEPADKKWFSIKCAVVGALANGDEDSAVKLLQSAVRLNIGGDELSGFCNLMDVSMDK